MIFGVLFKQLMGVRQVDVRIEETGSEDTELGDGYREFVILYFVCLRFS